MCLHIEFQINTTNPKFLVPEICVLLNKYFMFTTIKLYFEMQTNQNVCPDAP